jgi:hypothetical protein
MKNRDELGRAALAINGGNGPIDARRGTEVTEKRKPERPTLEVTRCGVRGRIDKPNGSVCMEKMLWHVSKSKDGSDADPDATMDPVFEHSEPYASVGKVIETTGSLLERPPIGCRRLDAGLTARHLQAIAPGSGVHG